MWLRERNLSHIQEHRRLLAISALRLCGHSRFASGGLPWGPEELGVIVGFSLSSDSECSDMEPRVQRGGVQPKIGIGAFPALSTGKPF